MFNKPISEQHFALWKLNCRKYFSVRQPKEDKNIKRRKTQSNYFQSGVIYLDASEAFDGWMANHRQQ